MIWPRAFDGMYMGNRRISRSRETSGVWQGLIGKRNRESRLHKDFTLDSFIKAGVLRLGLSLDCTNCMHQNWYGLERNSRTDRVPTLP